MSIESRGEVVGIAGRPFLMRKGVLGEFCADLLASRDEVSLDKSIESLSSFCILYPFAAAVRDRKYPGEGGRNVLPKRRIRSRRGELLAGWYSRTK